MILQISLIATGILISFFLKDINFLSLNFDFLSTGLIYPDFLLIFLIFFSLLRGEFAGLWIGFFAGLLEDSGLLSFAADAGEFAPIIGTHAVIYTLTGFTLGKLNRILDQESTVPIVVMVFSTCVAVRLLIWLLMGIFQDFNPSYSFLGPAFYTAFLSPIWFALLSWLYKPILEELS